MCTIFHDFTDMTFKAIWQVQNTFIVFFFLSFLSLTVQTSDSPNFITRKRSTKKFFKIFPKIVIGGLNNPLKPSQCFDVKSETYRLVFLGNNHSIIYSIQQQNNNNNHKTVQNDFNGHSKALNVGLQCTSPSFHVHIIIWYRPSARQPPQHETKTCLSLGPAVI